ncbi:butyrophilin subfamily 1 member A1-like, partial [Alligator sinensis]|uniref:Butyrophilin subfamily 1 member A1-like n=1 Tax=Alligator sinensis TaxID=38654 RepID=A0A3Q0FZE9_ALLSI
PSPSFASRFLCILLLLAVTFRVNGPNHPVTALVGTDALLPCHLSPSVSAAEMEALWFQFRYSEVVHLYRGGRDQPDKQIAQYRGGTELLKGNITEGKVSLRIRNITPSDEGQFVCFFRSPAFDGEAVLELEVAGLGSAPHLSVSGYQDGGIQVVCESTGWYPEPKMLWKDVGGKQLPSTQDKIHQQADGLFAAHSAIVITEATNQNVSCSVHHPLLDQEKSARINIAGSLFLRTSPWVVALSVILAIVCIFLLLSTYYSWKQRRAKEHLQSELEKERVQSLADLGWSKVKENAAHVTLDADTAHPSLCVAQGRRHVRWSGHRQDLPDNPERFDSETCVLGSE